MGKGSRETSIALYTDVRGKFTRRRRVRESLARFDVILASWEPLAKTKEGKSTLTKDSGLIGGHSAKGTVRKG